MLTTYEGGCHCGQVRFRVQGDLDDVSVCNCSVCTMKGIVHMVVPLEQFELLRGADAIATYTFGTGVAKHTFCRHCGIHSFYTPRSKPDGVSVNARCLDDVDIAALHPSPCPTGCTGRNSWQPAERPRGRELVQVIEPRDVVADNLAAHARTERGEIFGQHVVRVRP